MTHLAQEVVEQRKAKFGESSTGFDVHPRFLEPPQLLLQKIDTTQQLGQVFEVHFTVSQMHANNVLKKLLDPALNDSATLQRRSALLRQQQYWDLKTAKDPCGYDFSQEELSIRSQHKITRCKVKRTREYMVGSSFDWCW